MSLDHTTVLSIEDALRNNDPKGRKVKVWGCLSLVPSFIYSEQPLAIE